jgi:hypothetical protein
LLRNDNILHGGQYVEKDKHVLDEDLEDIETSSTAPSKAVATKECNVVGDNVLPTNPAFPLYNQCHIQFGENRAPTHCNVLPIGMNGVHMEVNVPVPSVGSINMHDPPHTDLEEVTIRWVHP